MVFSRTQPSEGSSEQLRLYAVEPSGPVRLPLPAGAQTFADLYQDVELGVYSALRTFEHHKFLELDGHLDRTEQSMELLGWAYEWDRQRFREALDTVCRAFPAPEMRVRFDILAAPANRLGTGSRELIALLAFEPPPESLYQTGVAVALAEPELQRANPLAKTADFAARRPPINFGVPDGAQPYEYLLTTADGRILEGTGTNFYAVREGVMYTAGEGVLEGITRRIILELAKELGIPVRLEALHVADIATLNEAALSGSSRAVLPVVRIEDHVISDGRPGPITEQLLVAYREYLSRHIRPAV